ncbi:hypothetical protein [Lactiplantibacillus plantarum]|uniref:hypothetical protein n=1 Tax=Lactiplantibacillus plantarum TaxID=1590 RepID=UPI001F1C88F8|nr:hypothetical protein [Lactiplantibacillus plantarum]MCF1425579.1 hypothetical protein [Lactiplantibacillus plantarum]
MMVKTIHLGDWVTYKPRATNGNTKVSEAPQVGQLIEQHLENGTTVNIVHNAKGHNDWTLAKHCQLVKRGTL